MDDDLGRFREAIDVGQEGGMTTIGRRTARRQIVGLECLCRDHLRELFTEPLLHGVREQLPNRRHRANTNRFVGRRNSGA